MSAPPPTVVFLLPRHPEALARLSPAEIAAIVAISVIIAWLVGRDWRR